MSILVRHPSVELRLGPEDGLAADRTGQFGESRERADRIAHRQLLVHAGELRGGHRGGNCGPLVVQAADRVAESAGGSGCSEEFVFEEFGGIVQTPRPNCGS